jgi:hypothetical protein
MREIVGRVGCDMPGQKLCEMGCRKQRKGKSVAGNRFQIDSRIFEFKFKRFEYFQNEFELDSKIG